MAAPSSIVLHGVAALAIFMLLIGQMISWSDAFCPAAGLSPASFSGRCRYAANNGSNSQSLFVSRINYYSSASQVGKLRNYRSRIAALSINADDGRDEGCCHPIEIVTGNNDGLEKSKSSPPPPSQSTSTLSKPSFPLVLWRFTRPHTIIGSAIAIPSIFLLAAPTYQSFFTMRSFVSLIYATVPSLFMNLYITGLNQITDVEIDKINKPELPMAKGDLSYSTACIVVLVALAISLTMSVIHPIFSSKGLQLALWGSCLLGTLYSLPPFRMKKHPLLAAFCIVAVRGTIINAGFYSHAVATAYDSVPQISGVLGCLLHDWKCAFSSLFFAIFGIVIALMKDVPDIDGDRTFNIRSFTVRMGQKRIFGTAKSLLALLFGVVGGALMKWTTMAQNPSAAVRRGVVGLSCWLAGWWVNKAAVAVDAEDSEGVYNYYMKLWNLFYLSYFALPFVS